MQFQILSRLLSLTTVVASPSLLSATNSNPLIAIHVAVKTLANDQSTVIIQNQTLAFFFTIGILVILFVRVRIILVVSAVIITVNDSASCKKQRRETRV
ncbi:hypothetical protein NMG60_11015563 [Bertholletia excelsa]